MEKKTFIHWLRSEVFKKYVGAGLSVIGGWLIALSTIFFSKVSFSIKGEIFESALKTPEGINYRALLIGVQALACFVLAILTPRPNKIAPDTENQYITVKATQRINSMVISLYISLTLLYLVMALFTWFETPEQAATIPNPADTWIILFEILTATLIFFLFIELSTITVEPRKALKIIDYRVYDARRHRIMFVAFAVVLVVSNIFLFYHPQVESQKLIRTIVACLSGVTLAMVVGRLGSLYLNPGNTTIFLLYLYAIIQAFASFFPKTLLIFVVTSFALPLKVLLWLVFVWAFTTGKIGEYVQEVREIIEKQDTETQLTKSDSKEIT